MPHHQNFLLFTIQQLRLAAEKRKQEAKERAMKVGIEVSWHPGNSLPPKSTGQAMLTKPLFADDTTLHGERDEMKEGKEVVKGRMKDCEEQCHEGKKEEHLALGTSAGGEIQVLGTWIGGKQYM